MTDTTARELIQRLANALHDAAEDIGFWGSYASGYFQEKHDLPGNIAKIHAQADEARAALSQPEPEGPTDEELVAIAIESELVASNGTNPFREDSDIEDEVMQFARTVLARWGHNTPTETP